MKFFIAGDHYAAGLMSKLSQQLTDQNIETENVGSKNENDKFDLQTIIPAVTKQVLDGKADFGILACGTGVGVEIGANRYKGIRASLCRDAEQAKNARVYDNANVLCLGSWYEDEFIAILNAWLDNKFDGNQNRTQMLKAFDELY